MRFIGRTLALAMLLAALPTLVLAAPTAATSKSVVLHVSSQFKANAAFKHVMASAKLRFTGQDVYINLQTDNLPAPRTLGRSVYALYVSDGAMTEKVGVLHGSGAMSGLTGQVMMARIQDLYVYAQRSAGQKRGGVLVLSAMVP